VAEARRSFVPAAGRDWLLPFYDPLGWLLRSDAARREIIDGAVLQPGQRVLDIGCGTGSLIVALGRLHPDVEIVGLDPDPKALARAARKVARAGLEVQLDQGFSDGLPYPDASFDRVFSSFMFHHLEADEKTKTLAEVRRVLEPGGSLHLLDFGGSGPRSHGFVAHLLHSSVHVHDQFGGRIPELMREVGFAAEQAGARRSMVGPIAYYRAQKRRDDLT
jgi:ubiquinone/menaquinone biosynthesis C-methylase UbiE